MTFSFVTSEVNKGYTSRFARLRCLDHQPIRNLKHLIELVDSGAASEERWLDFELDDRLQRYISLPRLAARRADFDIFREHRIPFYRPQSVAEKGARPEKRKKDKEKIEEIRAAFRKEAEERGWTQYLRVGVYDEDEGEENVEG